MINNIINAAIIGCGVISRKHATAIRANSDKVNLYAVCDIIEEKARKLACTFGVKNCYTDYKKMLEDDSINLVCICTPSGMHAEMAVDCAKAGKNVLCEKPLDVTHEKLDMMIKAFARTSLKLGSIFQYRTYSGIIKAKKMLDSGKLGKVYYANGYCKVYRGPEYYKKADWRGTWKLDGGGCLMNQAVHAIDILSWLNGDVESLKADVFTLARDIEVEDTAFALLNFKNKSKGFFHATTLCNPGIGNKVEIQCEKGRIEFVVPSTTLYKFNEKGHILKVPLDDKVILEDNSANDPIAIKDQGHVDLVRNIADAITNGTQPYITGQDGRHAVDVILAIYESSRQQKEIKLI